MGALGCPPCRRGLYGHDEVAATPSPALFPGAPIPGPPNIQPGPARRRFRTCCFRRPRRLPRHRQDRCCLRKGCRHHDPSESREGTGRLGVLPRPDDDGLRLSGDQFAAAARCGRPWAGRGELHRRGPECRYAGVEFAGHDQRRRRRQRRQDDRRRLARERRGVGQARRRDTGERRRVRGADQPAGIDASGAESAAGRTAERSPATRCHAPVESVVDLSHHRADAVLAVDHRQRRRAGTDRRCHPQFQRRGVGT